ncbi:MAG: glycosyltransferase [Planctomycetota bacterium]|nr:MAG: glycosyltransferase [Planctomycetota bacterium]
MSANGATRDRIRLTMLIPTLDRSGAEKQLALLATQLPREEFDLDVVALDRGGPYERLLEEHGIPVRVLGKRLKLDPVALYRLRRHLRERDPDILHTWLFAANAYGRLVCGKRSRTQVVVSERCVDSWKAGWQLALDRRLVSRTDALLANSKSVAEFYQDLGYPAGRTVVIPNAVAPPAPPDQTRQDLLTEYDLPPDAKLVCYVGRLAKQKRVDDLLWAAQVLRQADDTARFLIIGDGPERARLEQHARDVECAAYVRFLGHREDAARLMHLCDVFWLGSDFEGMSNSLLEAMACGLPVVVSSISPNREVVQHGVHGYLIDPGDGAGFAQYTLRLLRQPEFARQLGDAGRARIEREYTIEKMVSTHIRLYRAVMDEAEQAADGAG